MQCHWLRLARYSSKLMTSQKLTMHWCKFRAKIIPKNNSNMHTIVVTCIILHPPTLLWLQLCALWLVPRCQNLFCPLLRHHLSCKNARHGPVLLSCGPLNSRCDMLQHACFHNTANFARVVFWSFEDWVHTRPTLDGNSRTSFGILQGSNQVKPTGGSCPHPAYPLERSREKKRMSPALQGFRSSFWASHHANKPGSTGSL